MARWLIIAFVAALLAVGTYFFLPTPSRPYVPLQPGYVGSALEGEIAFKRYCSSCHRVQTPDGSLLAGNRTGAGPNLWGVIGRQAASIDFRYSSALAKAGANGLVWDSKNLAQFLIGPNEYLRSFLSDRGVRSKMAFRLNETSNPQAPLDIAAYLSIVAKN